MLIKMRLSDAVTRQHAAQKEEARGLELDRTLIWRSGNGFTGVLGISSSGLSWTTIESGPIFISGFSNRGPFWGWVGLMLERGIDFEVLWG